MSEFMEYLNEVFESFGPIIVKHMFGGYGVCHDGVMFVLVADDVLYLKDEVESLEHFKKHRLNQFEYMKKVKKINMPFFIAPEEIFDDPDEAKIRANRAYEAALRSKSRKKKTGNIK